MKTPVHSTRRRVLRGAGTLAKYLALAITAFVILMPILWFLTSSFRSNNEVFANINPFSFGKMFFGGYSLENYQTLFTKHQFAEPVLNTLLIPRGEHSKADRNNLARTGTILCQGPVPQYSMSL